MIDLLMVDRLATCVLLESGQKRDQFGRSDPVGLNRANKFLSEVTVHGINKELHEWGAEFTLHAIRHDFF